MQIWVGEVDDRAKVRLTLCPWVMHSVPEVATLLAAQGVITMSSNDVSAGVELHVKRVWSGITNGDVSSGLVNLGVRRPSLAATEAVNTGVAQSFAIPHVLELLVHRRGYGCQACKYPRHQPAMSRTSKNYLTSAAFRGPSNCVYLKYTGGLLQKPKAQTNVPTGQNATLVNNTIDRVNGPSCLV